MTPIEPYTRCTARLEQGDRIIPVRVISANHSGLLYNCLDSQGNKLSVHQSNLTPMPPNIPPRFKRSIFDYCAPTIGAALRAYPKAVEATPQGITPDTFARRIRDAITAKATYGYKHPQLDEELWKLYGSLLSVSSRDAAGHALIGPLQAVKGNDFVKITQPTIEMPGQKPSRFDARNGILLESLLQLLHHRALSPCPSVILTNLSPEQVISIESRYDLGLNPTDENPNDYIVIL